MSTSNILQSLFDHYPANIAIVDREGVIRCVNRGWKQYAADNDAVRCSEWTGTNYLEVCQASASEDQPDAQAMLTGFNAVFQQRVECFQHLYPCHSPIQQAWYLARIVPLEVDKKHLFMVSHEDRSTEVLMRQALTNHAETDSITGLPNRSGYFGLLERQWRRDRRTKTEVSLLVIGIDGLETHQSQYKDSMKDQCLLQVTKAIQTILRRPNDRAARIATTEFAVVLGTTSQVDALTMAERLRSNIEKAAIPYHGTLQSDPVTVSIGVASITPHRHLSAILLFDKANQAYYRAMSSGYNCVSL